MKHPSIGTPTLTRPVSHDPGTRERVHIACGWHILDRPEPRHATPWLLGSMHEPIQLWHPGQEVSILTPGARTEERLEVCCGGERVRICCFGHLARWLQARELPVPCPHVFRYARQLAAEPARLQARGWALA